MSSFTRDVTASGFNEAWDGSYEYRYTDHWSKSDGSYWIIRNSLYWFVSGSEFLYEEDYRKARLAMTYFGREDPKGSYTGIDGNPNGTIS